MTASNLINDYSVKQATVSDVEPVWSVVIAPLHYGNGFMEIFFADISYLDLHGCLSAEEAPPPFAVFQQLSAPRLCGSISGLPSDDNFHKPPLVL